MATHAHAHAHTGVKPNKQLHQVFNFSIGAHWTCHKKNIKMIFSQYQIGKTNSLPPWGGLVV